MEAVSAPHGWTSSRIRWPLSQIERIKINAGSIDRSILKRRVRYVRHLIHSGIRFIDQFQQLNFRFEQPGDRIRVSSIAGGTA
jgi:4-hydroxy-3-methylbut-2-en-1-yl diphosphate synthase IspG/GcpE